MKHKHTLWGSLLALLLPLSVSQADDSERIREALARIAPDMTIDSIERSPLNGLYEVFIGGTNVVYVSEDARYLFQGRLIDLKTREDVVDTKLARIRKQVIDGLDEEQMIVFGDEKLPHTVTIFTDIDCAYCQKLHQEMAGYNKAGIRVRYLLYPRAGVGSSSYRKAVSVWCSEDRQTALTQAKAGNTPPPKSCANPVDAHLAAGERVGVRGTPSILLEDGSFLPGYLPPERLAMSIAQKQ